MSIYTRIYKLYLGIVLNIYKYLYNYIEIVIDYI